MLVIFLWLRPLILIYHVNIEIIRAGISERKHAATFKKVIINPLAWWERCTNFSLDTINHHFRRINTWCKQKGKDYIKKKTLALSPLKTMGLSFYLADMHHEHNQYTAHWCAYCCRKSADRCLCRVKFMRKALC